MPSMCENMVAVVACKLSVRIPRLPALSSDGGVRTVLAPVFQLLPLCRLSKPEAKLLEEGKASLKACVKEFARMQVQHTLHSPPVAVSYLLPTTRSLRLGIYHTSPRSMPPATAAPCLPSLSHAPC